MDTNATLDTTTGHIDAQTRTRTVTDFGGFTGGVSLVFYDSSDTTIGQTNDHTYGVDGRFLGRSDRTDYWGEDIDPSVAARVVRFDILHFWAPRYSAVANIVDHAVQAGMKAAPLLDQLKKAGIIK